ncbi:MAG: Ca-activated chloride channel family protein [Parvibaculaceae bacterium]|jgi:Ca-activated chloride channel family protein
MDTQPEHSALRKLIQSRGFHFLLASILFILLVLSFVPNLALADTSSTPPATPKPTNLEPRLVGLNDMTSGGLLYKATEPGKYVQAPLLTTDVSIDVTGPIGRTRVTQRFENPTDAWLEGTYVFPLPENSAVDTMKMIIGGRIIEGEIHRKETAKQMYERAKAQGKRASLTEQLRPNMFTNSVANIGPGESIIIQIEYQQTVKQSGPTFSLRFPMVVAPRYNPAPILHTVDFGDNGMGTVVTDPVEDREKITPPTLRPDGETHNPVSLSLTLNAGFPLGDVVSHHHKITQKRIDEDKITLALENTETPANRDFELTWEAANKGTPVASLFKEQIKGKDHILLMLTPPVDAEKNVKTPPREIIFVIDTSGSMAGESMPQAKAGLMMALKRLNPSDRFNVISFNHEFKTLFQTAVPADREHMPQALKFVNSLSADGGTEMLGAMKEALSNQQTTPNGYLRQVVFLTDGAIGNENQLFMAISDHLGESRLFPVGIGSAPNSHFMNRAAQMGRGTFTHIGSLAQVQSRMEELFYKLERPVLTDLALKWPDGQKVEAWPARLPDLYAGEPIVLSARMGKASGTLIITGQFENEAWAVNLPLDKAAQRPGIAKLWARNKIADLEFHRLRSTDYQRFDDEITQVALDHHLVSRLTSLVAIDKTPARPASEELHSTDVPLNLPAGWDFDAVFGEPEAEAAMQQNAARFKTMAPQMLAMSAPPSAAPKTAKMKKGAALPQTATAAELSILFGLFLLALSALIWGTRRFLKQKPAHAA